MFLSFEQRRSESELIMAKYPERLPIIVDKHCSSLNIPEININKHLVPSDLTFSQMVYVIRKRIEIPAEQGMYFL